VRGSAHRLVAIALLAWLGAGATAAPLVACCAGAEPCCVTTVSGLGCGACATTPCISSGSALPGPAVEPVRPADLDAATVRAQASRPWKPPD
jgi:hypothetical protein